MSHEIIKDLKAGDKVVAFFVVRKKEVRTKRGSHELYLALELGDRSGRISGTIWNDFEVINKNIEVGNVVKVKGTVIDFHDNLHLSIAQIRLAKEEENTNPEDFIAICPESTEKMLGQLEKLVGSIQNEYLAKLLNIIFKDQQCRNRRQ